MYHYKQQIKTDYRMAAPPPEPPLQRSRGIALFDRQAQLHGNNRDSLASPPIADVVKPYTVLRKINSSALPTTSASSSTATNLYPHASARSNPRSNLPSTESYVNSSDNNVQLIRINPRPELSYMKDMPPQPQPPTYHKVPLKLQETDFPLHDPPKSEEFEKHTSDIILPNNSTHTSTVVKSSNDSPKYDDDDDVIHASNDSDDQQDDSEDESSEQEEDSVNITDHDETTIPPDPQYNSGVDTISSTRPIDKRNDYTHNEETLKEHQSQMESSTKEGAIEEYNSDFDNSSFDEDEPLTHKDSVKEYEEEKKHQLIIQQQKVLWSIVQEWSRKEETCCEELKRLEEQAIQVPIQGNFLNLIKKLFDLHKKVNQEIEDLYDQNHEPVMLIRCLTHAVDTLVGTLPAYDEYIKINLAPIRKLFEKRTSINPMPIEDLLSIPPKQFLQILSQVQDLYQTAQSLESTDAENLNQLYNYAQMCKLYSSRQDENINKVILKNEEVATMLSKGHRDRCRLIMYPDAIVTCILKTKLLTSPKYTLLWFSPVLELQSTISQNSSDNNTDTGDELKTSLKSGYQELEKSQKNNNQLASRLSKTIRKQEHEFNLAQSKIQLILSNAFRPSSTSTILFSSAYQLQEWVDLIDRTKQDLIQRSSAVLNQTNNQQRLNDSIIQKRLDLIKPNLCESNSNESSLTVQTISPSKTYSGTLTITIHCIQGSALYNPIRPYQTLPAMSSLQQVPKNYEFYVAVEIDSYNTFNTHAKTRTQMMQQPELVEFKTEEFHIELEYSLAFRFLIYRIDPSGSDSRNASQKESCIGKFHRDIETALHECRQSPNGTTCFESPSGDLKLKISLQYSKREGTFKRQPSKRTHAIFGKSIEKLINAPNGHINGIPRIIVKCIEMVERDGLDETGIYRVCCVASELQKLRSMFDRDWSRAEEMLAQKNVHVAANLLKLFFRELPEPLFTSTLYKQFVNAIQLTDIDNQRVTLLKTFELLEPVSRKILLYLFDHLICVSKNSSKNMMHLDNLAVVFGPTLMRPSKLTVTCSGSNQRLNAATSNSGSTTSTDIDQMSSELQGSMYQCQVVLACLKLRQIDLLK